MNEYIEELFSKVENLRGKALADRIRLAFMKIQVVKDDTSDAAYQLKQRENLAVVTELQNAGGFIAWNIIVNKYSATSTQVELRHKDDNRLIWRDFTFVSDFAFGLADNIVYSQEQH